jgi:hypothetical protein
MRGYALILRGGPTGADPIGRTARLSAAIRSLASTAMVTSKAFFLQEHWDDSVAL